MHSVRGYLLTFYKSITLQITLGSHPDRPNWKPHEVLQRSNIHSVFNKVVFGERVEGNGMYRYFSSNCLFDKFSLNLPFPALYVKTFLNVFTAVLTLFKFSLKKPPLPLLFLLTCSFKDFDFPVLLVESSSGFIVNFLKKKFNVSLDKDFIFQFLG